MSVIRYEEIELLKQSEKSKICLVREKDGERFFIKKMLRGTHNIYKVLQSCTHPYLPMLYEVSISDGTTTIIEEYIEGQTLENTELSESGARAAARELCTVLGFLHAKGIIHRDIKPSNIILAKDGHIRLIDFDAARMPKTDAEQDTKLLGTRGYAPPEQYGFSQTDERTDIYALGVTLQQLFGEKAQQQPYQRMIRKCTNLNPEKRYQSARQVKRAFSCRERYALYCTLAILLFAVAWGTVSERQEQLVQEETAETAPTVSETALTVLPAPENPHWYGETGIAQWGNVPESGREDNVDYRWRLYWKSTATPPDPSIDLWGCEDGVRSAWNEEESLPVFEWNIASEFWVNGYYYFAVCAVGDGVQYADSPYAMSDVFYFSGESAPALPKPTGLAWKVIEDEGPQHFATWGNLDDYLETDSFHVCVFDQEGVIVARTYWTKKEILDIGHGGVWFKRKFLPKEGGAYRFTVQAMTSRPNEYSSSVIPYPVPEEYYSPWLYHE